MFGEIGTIVLRSPMASTDLEDPQETNSFASLSTSMEGLDPKRIDWLLIPSIGREEGGHRCFSLTHNLSQKRIMVGICVQIMRRADQLLDDQDGSGPQAVVWLWQPGSADPQSGDYWHALFLTGNQFKTTELSMR